MKKEKKEAPAPNAADAKKNKKVIKRVKRSALERKCLSRSAKMALCGCSRAAFRSEFIAEQISRGYRRKGMGVFREKKNSSPIDSLSD